MPSMRATRFFIIVLALACISGDRTRAQTNPPTDLDAYVTRTMKTFDVPGIAVAIVKDGKIVFAKGYGVRKLGDPNPVDENTLFGIGSNTKAFTAAALATLVDQGKISWDDPVYQRLPGFQMYDPYVSHEMTIRDLLTHRSGMGLGEGDLLFWPHTTFTRQEIIYRLRFMKPASSFRSHYAYDNLLYMTAGQIIPAVTGTSWDDYVREKIFTPLGMKSTTISTTAFKPGDNYAFPHSKVDGKLQVIPFQDLDNAGPAGSINSSVAEMCKWFLLQLNHGKFPDRDGRLFSEAQSHEMWSSQTILPIDEPEPARCPRCAAIFAAYGLGWFLPDYKGRKLVGHSGGLSASSHAFKLIPEENLGVVVLTNAEQVSAMESIVFHIVDHYLRRADHRLDRRNEGGNDDKKRKKPRKSPKRLFRAAPKIPNLHSLEKYAGVYTDPWYGPATIKLQNGQLVFTLDHTPAAVADLQHWQYDTFKAHWRDRTIEDAFVTFALKPDGAIDHFTMQAVSPLADFSFDYQDLYFTPQKAAAAK